jgi:hypothetical protein
MDRIWSNINLLDPNLVLILTPVIAYYKFIYLFILKKKQSFSKLSWEQDNGGNLI